MKIGNVVVESILYDSAGKSDINKEQSQQKSPFKHFPGPFLLSLLEHMFASQFENKRLNINTYKTYLCI